VSYVNLPAGVQVRLDAARPVLARNAAQGEADRRIPDESIDALVKAGLFRLMVSKRYGGYEGSIGMLIEAAASVAETDGAAGWVIGLSQVSAWAVGLLSGKAQDDVFGADPDARVCGSLNPVGSGEEVSGGYRISGRWSYVSGSLHAQWALLGFSLPEDVQGGPGLWVALVPMADLKVHDTWHVAGMRGTGSNTVTCEDVFVPGYRTMSHTAALGGEYPSEFKDETVYHAAWAATLTLALVGPVVGIGRAALEHVRTAAEQKGIVATKFERQADSPGFQIKLAEAALRLDSAQLHAFRAADDIDRHAELQALPDYNTRARVRADAAVTARYVTEAISALLDAHGSGGFAEASPLHRMWQDANVGARHALLNGAVSCEVYGTALLGVENDVSMIV
jgi:3-hydroxy-9,10-secoandrosta-1,3,5(10)-triene-9,17-dione monooxygenase